MPYACLDEFIGDGRTDSGCCGAIAEGRVSALPLDPGLLQSESESSGENDGVVRDRSARRVQPFEHEFTERTRGVELIRLLQRLNQILGAQCGRLDLQIRQRCSNQLGRFGSARLGLGAGGCEIGFVLRGPRRQDRDGGQRCERDGETQAAATAKPARCRATNRVVT